MTTQKGGMRMLMAAALLLAVLGLVGCGGGGGGDSTPPAPPPATTNDVTLAGTMNVAAPAATAGRTLAVSRPLLSSDPTDYTLYCVTFTDPPQSGTGAFDASGNYSVTIPDAAGLAVGCFITETATSTVAATVTFALSADETASGASFSGGTHTVSISFDADTGSATADVSTTASTPVAGSGTLTPADLVDEWSMTCAPPDGTAAGEAAWEACLEFVPPRIFVDVLTADVDTDSNGTYETTAYLMAVWRSLPTYEAANGAASPTHEGMATDAIPPAEVDLTSLTSLYTSNDPTNGANGGFAGLTSVPSWAWDGTNGYFTALGDDVEGWLTNNGLTYDATFDDPDGGSCGALNQSTPEGRQCLLLYLEYLQKQSEDVVPFDAPSATAAKALLIPRVDEEAWDVFVNAPSGDGTTLVVPFKETTASPDIRARYSMMDLEVAGDAIIANEYERKQSTKTDGSGTPCEYYHSTTITFTRQSGSATNLVGWFVSAEGNDCDPVPESSTATFKVIFSPLAASATMVLADLDGDYISGCQIDAWGGDVPSYRSTTLSVGSGTATVREYDYGTNPCNGPVEAVTEMQADIGLIEDRPTAWGDTPATLASVTVTSMTVTPYSDAKRDQFIADTAYGSASWTTGTPSAELVAGGQVTEYDGVAGPASHYDLFYVDPDGRLYIGIEENRNAYGVPADVKPGFAPVSASTASMSTLNGKSFGTFCMQDNRTEYNAQSRSQSFAFTGTTITVTETYHADTECDFAQRTVEEVQVLPAVDDSPAGGQPFTTRGFASPIVVTFDSTDLAFSHTVEVFDATAASAMTTDSAFGVGTWTAGAGTVPVGTTEYNGTDPGPSTFPVAFGEADGGYAFLIIPDAPSGFVPVTNGDGYGLVVKNDDPAIEIASGLAISDLDNTTWISSCENKGGGDSGYQVLYFDTGGLVNSQEFYFASSTTCEGASTTSTGSLTVAIDAPTPEVHGGFGEVAFASTSTGECGLVQVRGGLLYADFDDGPFGTCTGNYPASITSPPLERVVTPLTDGTLPVAAFSSCRNSGGTDELEMLRVFGNAVLVRNVQLDSTGGTCDGNVTDADFFAAQLTFTGTVVSTERGAATRVDVADPFFGDAMGTLLHLEQSGLYVGDDSGVVPPAYPTTLSEDAFTRRF